MSRSHQETRLSLDFREMIVNIHDRKVATDWTVLHSMVDTNLHTEGSPGL